MAVKLPNRDVHYYPVPKVACTSVKELIYQLETGSAFPFDKRYPRGVHEVYYTIALSEPVSPATTAFAIVRDPIDRLLSAYQNRVLQYRELGPKRLIKGARRALRLKNRTPVLRHSLRFWSLGLPIHPDPDTFFENYDAYRLCSTPIRHHTDPITMFLGHDLRAFKKTFRLEALGELEAFLSELYGRDLHLPRSQKSHGGKPKFDDLSKKARQNILSATYGDYALLRDYLKMPV